MAEEIGALATVQCSAKTRDNLKTVFDIAVNVLLCALCDVVCVGIKVLSRESLYYSLICAIDVFYYWMYLFMYELSDIVCLTLPRLFFHFTH